MSPSLADLRPQSLTDWIGGQVGPVRMAVEAARRRGEAAPHMLFHGPPGVGKTTLARLVARELQEPLEVRAAPSVEGRAELSESLHRAAPGVWFLDELHALPPRMAEWIYPVLEEGTDPSGGELPELTVIGATTKIGHVLPPLRSRFAVLHRLTRYGRADLADIAARSAEILGVELTDAGAREVAERSRGIPRECNRIVLALRDYGTVRGGALTRRAVIRGCEELGVLENGLKPTHMEILQIVQRDHGGGPVGLERLASDLDMDTRALANYWEPPLLDEGMLELTARGRVLTASGRRAVAEHPEGGGREPPSALFVGAVG